MNTEKTKSNKKWIILVSVFIVVIAAFVLIYVFNKPSGNTNTKTITVETVYINQPSDKIKIKTDAEFLGQALKEKNMVEGDETSMGLFIQKVNGVEADSSKKEWWRITKDGEEVMTGVDTTPIENGDEFKLTLTQGY